MRSNAINYLKCIAAMLVINTHISVLYPSPIRFLAFGGYFANSIFFFVSGYCLTKTDISFGKWYIKRFFRVYTPYLFALPFLFFAGVLEGWNILNVVMPFEAYHFIPTILLLYIIYYFLSKLNRCTRFKYIYQVLFLLLLALLYFFVIFDKQNRSTIEHFSFIEIVFYLIPMLLGGFAKDGNWIKSKMICSLLVAFSFGLYVLQSFRPLSGDFKILQPCIGLFFSYGLACLLLTIENKLIEFKFVDFISSVTLECYIVQFISRDAFSIVGFPTNILYHVVCSLSVAYCLHYISDCVLKKIVGKTSSL